MQNFTHAMQDHAQETKQLRGDIREYLATRPAPSSSDTQNAEDTASRTARERKMEGTTLRGQLREKRVQAKARRQQRRRSEDDDEADDEDDGDTADAEEMDPEERKEHLNILKVSYSFCPSQYVAYWYEVPGAKSCRRCAVDRGLERFPPSISGAY